MILCQLGVNAKTKISRGDKYENTNCIIAFLVPPCGSKQQGLQSAGLSPHSASLTNTPTGEIPTPTVPTRTQCLIFNSALETAQQEHQHLL